MIRDDEIDPASIYGGTWTKIQGRFLLASGGGYLLGAEGGEAEHNLTYQEMPPHMHDVKTTVNAKIYTGTTMDSQWQANQFYVSGGGSYKGNRDNQQFLTADAGNGYPHNNMPPYTVVNIWKRII